MTDNPTKPPETRAWLSEYANTGTLYQGQIIGSAADALEAAMKESRDAE